MREECWGNESTAAAERTRAAEGDNERGCCSCFLCRLRLGAHSAQFSDIQGRSWRCRGRSRHRARLSLVARGLTGSGRKTRGRAASPSQSVPVSAFASSSLIFGECEAPPFSFCSRSASCSEHSSASPFSGFPATTSTDVPLFAFSPVCA